VLSGEGRVSAPQRYLALRFIVAFLAAVSLVVVGTHAYAPTSVATGVLAPMTFILAGTSAAAAALALAYALLSYPAYRKTIFLLTLIVLGLLAAHLYTINLPDAANCNDSSKNVQGCIMDEVYYVPAAQTMLSGEKCAPYADNCNLEHPFLSKAFIAAGIAIFGNTAYGWRIFEVILGTFSVPVIFGICWTTTKNQRLALYAAFLLAFETLFFVHSSIAVIDVGSIFFGLLGFLFYFAKVRWWKFDSIILSGIAFGLAALSKETAIFLLLVLFLYHLFFAPGSRKEIIVSTTKLVASVFIVFAVGLQIYDGAFGAGTATTFVGQIDFILKYGASLTMTPSTQACLNYAAQVTTTSLSCGWIDSVLHTPITPWNWVTYYSPVGYLVTSVKVTAGATSYTYISAGYYGVTNQFEVWLVYLWGGYTAYLWWKTRGKTIASESDATEFRLARIALLWFLVVFIGYVALFYYGRITYPYYFISAVPSLAIGGAYFLTRSWFPRPVAYIFLAGVFLWFFIFYPDKAFLPTQVRVWLGH
jgi:4-amino-4-deoxy-L-arabinose transferase-like glycosyltransferase